MIKDNKPSILLAYPSCFHYPVWMERLELKTSQLLLASYLAQFFPVEYADFEITIGRPNTETQIRRYRRKVRDFLSGRDFDILALSCWTSLSYQATLMTAGICRELYPDKLIVVGGYHPSARPHEFITDDNLIDYVICGEGEIPLKEIAEGLEKTGRPERTRIIKAPVFPLDQFVGYNWELVEDFVRTNLKGTLANIYIYLSRGCPFGCSFCMEPLKDRSWRAFPPEQALAQFETPVERYRSLGLAVCDACFGMRPGWRKEFLRRLAEMKPDFWFIFETRPEYIDEEDAKLLSDLKVEIQFGVESCSNDMLLLMKKTRQPQKFLGRFREVSRMLSDYGVLHRANLIFNHPGETRKTLGETFAFMDKELDRSDTYLIWACHGYMHFPGCELDTNMKYYEEQFGSRFLCGDWWKDSSDQYESSMLFVPSSDLDSDDVDLWEKMLDERKQKMKRGLAQEAFNFAAKKYFLDWQDDPRFEKS
ncbi:MAG: radical SAM protein [Candidatus Zixiibacteriota bacterium]|nr:MAG: radical SAM protein [candidate division Zixibacteria bacterium]